jgi:hypothetical protein
MLQHGNADRVAPAAISMNETIPTLEHGNEIESIMHFFVILAF